MIPVVVVVVLTFTHRYDAIRARRTGSNNSGEEDYNGILLYLLLIIGQKIKGP